MSVQRQQNHMRLQAALAAGRVGKPKAGLITDYDPAEYAAKVMLQPEGIETGWLKIETAMAGAGFGIFAGPLNGAQAMVSFLEGDREVGWVTGFITSDVDVPPPVPAGEIWAVHKTVSFLKFTNDGDVLVSAHRDMVAGVGRNLIATVTGDVTATIHGDLGLTVDGDITSSANSWSHTGDLSLDGDINATGTITGQTDVVGGGKSLKTHVHTDPQGGDTGQPV